MGIPAARVGDNHACPMLDGPKPHVGGPVLPPGKITVLIGGMPAARVGDKAICASAPDVIVKGEMSVLIGGAPAARLGDTTAHGGAIVIGCPTVHIGVPGAAGVDGKSRCPSVSAEKADEGIENALKEQKKMLEEKKNSLGRWDAKDQESFKKWFGSTDDAAKKEIASRIDKMLAKNATMTKANFFPAAPPDNTNPGLYAYVYPNQEDKVYLGQKFCTVAVSGGADTKAGTLCHEMSHYDSMGATDDHVYGQSGAEALAKSKPADALNNADNFQYFCEGL